LVAIVFDGETLESLRSVELPDRGHGIAVRPPAQDKSHGAARRNDLVVFARRPGNFAVVFSLDQSRAALWLATRPDRHFFGHGVYSADGALLYTTENDFAAGVGVIGVRDATQGYKQIGELPAGGIDPHQVILLSDGRTLVVANGGIRTHPDEPRLENDTATMQPSLAYVDSANGEVLERHELEHDLHKLSIRHLCTGAGNKVMFGCQFRGPAWETQACIGSHLRGEALKLHPLPDQLDARVRNYVASLDVDRNGETAVIAAPHGGLAVVMEVATGRYLAHYDMANVFGVAGGRSGFLLTSSDGGLASADGLAGVSRPLVPLTRLAGQGSSGEGLASAWDNHIAAVR
jgi:hypothetical protein